MKRIKKYSILFIIFMIIVIIMFLFSLLIDTNSYISNEEYIQFEQKINLVLEKINNIYSNNQEYIGIQLINYLEKDKYKKQIEDISSIYKKEIISEDYYFLDGNSKIALGISQLEEEYIVNYKLGEVFCLRPVRYNGRIYYTSQAIDRNASGNKEYSYYTPIIPKGFRYMTGNWDTGFVISDENENEFVWVPVGYLNEQNPGEYLKKYYDTYEIKNEEEEFIAIKNSVNKYGGFYIARYEASLKGATQTSSKGNTNVLQSKKNIMPISNVGFSTQKYEYLSRSVETGFIDINIPVLNKGFYGYTSEGDLQSIDIKEIYNEETQTTTKIKPQVKGALEMARDMSNDYKWDSSVHSTLVYGEQIDTLLKIIEKKDLLADKNVENLNAIKEDNTLWGNFINSEFRYVINSEMFTKNKNEGILLPTGVTTYKLNEDIEDNRNSVFNIYDLAGNLNEWTMEEILGTHIVIRGGSFDSNGSKNITNYMRVETNDISNNLGIRVVLFID